MRKIKLSLVMPVRNEGINLKMMLKILKATMEMSHEVLVVCDDERDNSIPIVKEVQKDYPGLKLVINRYGRGVANAIRAGAENAKGEYVFIIVADDTGPVLAVERMVEMMDMGYDFVSATRYSNGGRVYGGSFFERIFSRTANIFFRILAGAKLTDSTVGFKMFRPDFLKRVKLEGRPIGWLVAFEMSIKAQFSGVRMGEVPIISINRFYGGKSSFKLKAWTKEYLKWFFRGVWMLRMKTPPIKTSDGGTALKTLSPEQRKRGLI